jgi:hypothetical protein
LPLYKHRRPGHLSLGHCHQFETNRIIPEEIQVKEISDEILEEKPDGPAGYLFFAAVLSDSRPGWVYRFLSGPRSTENVRV